MVDRIDTGTFLKSSAMTKLWLFHNTRTIRRAVGLAVTILGLMLVLSKLTLHSYDFHRYQQYLYLLGGQTAPQNNVRAQTTDYVSEYPADDMRRQLAEQFPYDTRSDIPKTIWQTWKEPLHQIKNKELVDCIGSWVSQDGYDHHLMLDKDIDAFLDETYNAFPQIIEAMSLMPLPILKFDFFRYLVIYAKGGIYSDIDTMLFASIDEWKDSTSVLHDIYPDLNSNIGLVVGVEADLDRPDWRFRACRRLQFCQWTIKGKKGHPVLRELIYSITKITLEQYSKRLNHVRIGSEYFTLNSLYTVLEWTGPGIFTDTIFNHLNKVFDPDRWFNSNAPPRLEVETFDKYNTERNHISVDKPLGWNNFTRVTVPMVVDDVVILPINCFNAELGPDGIEFEVDRELEYVKHNFIGSWKG